MNIQKIVRTFVERSLFLQPRGGIQDDDDEDDDDDDDDGEDDEDDGPHLTRTGISGAGESNVKHHARRHIGSC